ncbi:MAG: ribulose-phosphate 3-epimerase [Dehalococcoidia bacterium]|nr:ribulose-phosphate 3-epimerase [Dehalococcoidia bacterium]
MKILPAILTNDEIDLEKKIRQAELFTDWVQVDIMDGQFVPSCSIIASHLSNIQTRLNLEIHLMVKEPESQVEGYARAGATRIAFHYEATPSPDNVIKQVRKLKLGVGLAINPETPISSVEGLLDKIDFILFLSVHPGFYGKEFLPEVLDKVKEFRAKGFKMEVGMDGGIKADNIKMIKDAGVDYACVGSGVFNHGAPQDAYRNLVKLVKNDE